MTEGHRWQSGWNYTGFFGGGQTGQYLRRRAESVHFTVGGEPVGQAARRAAAGAALLAQYARRHLTSEGKLLLEYVSHALGLLQSGEEKLAAVAAAADRRADHRRERHGDEDVSSLAARGVPSGLSRHPHPDFKWHESMVLDYLHAGQVDIAFASDVGPGGL